MAMVAVNDDMFTDDVIADPYTYYGRLREEDPVHWNDKYALWVITRQLLMTHRPASSATHSHRTRRSCWCPSAALSVRRR